MTKYILKCRSGISEVEEQELDWSKEDFDSYENGDESLNTEARGIANELTNLEYWVEKARKDVQP